MVRITAKAWGPILIEGQVELVDQDGNPLTPPPAKTPGQIKLCSCGHSGTRPFCDGTHKQVTRPVRGA
jgi:CDGSH-type Zn-finger protein